MTQSDHTLLLGAHISVSGGFHEAINRACAIGCTTLQIFTKSNRQWNAKPITTQEADLFKKYVDKSSIKTVIAHAAYLINLGSDNELTREKSVTALIDELQRCDQLGIPYLVLHPGSKGSQSDEQFLDTAARNIDRALLAAGGKTMLLLETMAGQGSSMGHLFAHLAHMRQKVDLKDRIGVCLDTCHIFAAGYDLRSPETYQAVWKEFDRIIGKEQLKVIHINDSKKGFAERVDRHEHIGKGQIGARGFELLFNDERLFGIPKILETPKEALEDDLNNMRFITGLITQENKNRLKIEVR